MATNSPPPPSASAPPHITTETFQKHYGRGSGYPPDHSRSHHGGHRPLPPRHYPPSHHYAQGQPPPPPPLPHSHHRGGPHSSHGYAHTSWYYPPHAASGAAADHSPDTIDPPPHDIAPRAGKAPGGVPHSALVTPKSHDSETLPNVAAADIKSLPTKKAVSKSSSKRSNKSKKKEGGKFAFAKNDNELEMEEEPKVEPMKQDFHFYAADQYGDIKQQCRQQLEQSYTDGTMRPDKSKELYILTTLLNARLIRNWEMAPPSTHAEYLKREEGDRKRFMSEEEVASRHCATLTARRRSPKQSGAGGVGRAESFGLGATVEVPSSPAVCVARGMTKRHLDEEGADESGTIVKRVKV